jgi:polar amino acid transport system substrate-binding protein
MRGVVDIIRHHHERWDGTGYPDGLTRSAIPVESRILAVADSYDAMTTERPYSRGLTPEAAFVEIDRCSGSQFDATVVDAFLRAFDAEDLRLDADAEGFN